MDESDSGPERRRWPVRVLIALAVTLCVSGSASAQSVHRTPAPEAATFPVGDLIIVLLLIGVNGLFSMAEAAFLSVRRSRVEQLVEEGNHRAIILSKMLAEPTKTLSTIQVGITVIALFTAGTAADSAVAPLRDALTAALPGTWIARYAAGIAFAGILLVVSFLTIVLGEITPKSLAVERAEPIALAAAYPLRAIQALLGPVVVLVTRTADVMVRPFGSKAVFHGSAMSEEELKLMVEQSEEYGVIEPQEKAMIHSIFDFGDTSVRRVMTPRLDVTAVSGDTQVAALIEAVKESGHSRLPVYDGNLDQIVGVVHIKDVLDQIAQGGRMSVQTLMRPPYFVPENKRVDDLLAEFRRNKNHFAIVRDEYGTVVGVVTIEDLIEEIIGDIQDEYDAEDPEVTQLDSTTAIVDGRMSIQDFNERMGMELDVEETDTLAGFVFGLIGHQPDLSEEIAFGNLLLRVEATDGRRIQKIRVTRVHAGLEPAALRGERTPVDEDVP